MLKNDRMMMILTGLVLAIFAGTMVKYGDRVMGLMSGGDTVSVHDDSYSVRAGSSQILDVLSNDEIKGEIVVLSNPACGTVALTGTDKLTFSSSSSCQGQVEFAYCVNSDGKCEPNNVKINVISVAFAQNNSANAPAATHNPAAPNNTAIRNNPAASAASRNNPAASAASTPAKAPMVVAQSAPQIESFSVEMSPPQLASPSLSEMVSPSVAVASIRQANGNLTQSATVDQNISTQNSASVAQTTTTAPTVFASPDMGESNNIMLGSSGSRMASNAPTGLQPSSRQPAVAVAEHGPEALASLSASRILPANTESAPRATNPERTSFNPGNAENTQTAAATPDASFNAAPLGNGPIALVALNPVDSGNASGESLNVFLSEPGLQSFASPPSALAPAAPGPESITLLERAPQIADSVIPPRAIGGENSASVFYSTASDPRFSHINLQAETQPAMADSAVTVQNSPAASPVQVSILAGLERKDIVSPYIVVSHASGTARAGTTPQILARSTSVESRPSIDMTSQAPAGNAPIQQASLETPVQPAPHTTPAQNSACDISLTANSTQGANIAVEVNAPCKPVQMLTFNHAGLAFSMLTDEQGSASAVLPALQSNAEISVMFTDGSQSRTNLTVPGIDQVVRVAVSWTNGLNLDLEAHEFGQSNAVNAQSPRDYRTARLQGGGYLLQLGDPTLAGGQQAEVYSIPIARQQRGTIALSVSLTNPSAVCGRSISAKTIRSRPGQTARSSSIRFTVPACGNLDSQIELPGAVNNIRLAGR